MDCKKLDTALAQKCAQRIAQPDENATLAERFRDCALKNGAKGIKVLGCKFRIMDNNGNRKLEWDEFLHGCRECRIARMTDEELKKVFEEYDKDGSGSLDYEEFLASVRPPMNEARRALVKRAFDKMDKSGDGVINIDDMKGVYNARFHPKYNNGEMTEAEVYAEYLKNFEAEGSVDGKVTLDEWYDYYSGISYSIDDDAYFSLMIHNCWKI